MYKKRKISGAEGAGKFFYIYEPYIEIYFFIYIKNFFYIVGEIKNNTGSDYVSGWAATQRSQVSTFGRVCFQKNIFWGGIIAIEFANQIASGFESMLFSFQRRSNTKIRQLVT